MLVLGEQHAAVQQVLHRELAQVQRLFAQELASDLPCVNELAVHLEQYHGKMLRPTLVLISALAVRPDRELTQAHLTLVAVVEMVHMATLVHDDVLDEQDVRRGGVTVNRLRGNEAAVMLGDYLISHAYHLCSSLDAQEAARLIARSTNTVCEGELLQLYNRNNWQLDETTYFQIIHRKTAALCGVACRLGAMFAQGSEFVYYALEQYGEKLGAAFQIIDDVLDLTGDPAIVGKSLGKDLEKGKLTLPLIHRLNASKKTEREHLTRLLDRADEPAASEISTILAASDSLAHTRRAAERMIDEACKHLDTLPDSDARRCLHSMAQAVIARDH